LSSASPHRSAELAYFFNSLTDEDLDDLQKLGWGCWSWLEDEINSGIASGEPLGNWKVSTELRQKYSVKPVIIHSEAREELDSAIAHYQEQKAGQGLDFLSGQVSGKIQQTRNLGESKFWSLPRRYPHPAFSFPSFFYAEFQEFILLVAIAIRKVQTGD